MRLRTCLLVAALMALAAPSPVTTVSQNGEAAVRAVLADYVSGWREGDLGRLERVFAPEGRVMWRSGQGAGETLGTMTFAQILERGSRPQPEYGLEWNVLSLDVVDDSLAVARLHISRAGGSYVDALTLYRIAGDWRIVSKTFVTR